MSHFDEYSEPTCPKCGSDDFEWEECWACFGEGEFDLHEEDPVNFAEAEEFETCYECDGEGGYFVCHACAMNTALGPPIKETP
jgi:DnaJ-class molecular chaperone